MDRSADRRAASGQGHADALAGTNAGKLALRDVRLEDQGVRGGDRQDLLVLGHAVPRVFGMREDRAVDGTLERGPDEILLGQGQGPLRVQPLGGGSGVARHLPGAGQGGLGLARNDRADLLAFSDGVAVGDGQRDQGAGERRPDLLLGQGHDVTRSRDGLREIGARDRGHANGHAARRRARRLRLDGLGGLGGLAAGQRRGGEESGQHETFHGVPHRSSSACARRYFKAACASRMDASTDAA